MPEPRKLLKQPAKKFDVSEQAMEFRLVNLGLEPSSSQSTTPTRVRSWAPRRGARPWRVSKCPFGSQQGALVTVFRGSRARGYQMVPGFANDPPRVRWRCCGPGSVWSGFLTWAASMKREEAVSGERVFP